MLRVYCHDCELERHTLCSKLSDTQIFMNDLFNMILCHLQSFNYLNKLHFTYLRNYFADFFDVFVRGSHFCLILKGAMLPSKVKHVKSIVRYLVIRTNESDFKITEEIKLAKLSITNYRCLGLIPKIYH